VEKNGESRGRRGLGAHYLYTFGVGSGHGVEERFLTDRMEDAHYGKKWSFGDLRSARPRRPSSRHDSLGVNKPAAILLHSPFPSTPPSSLCLSTRKTRVRIGYQQGAIYSYIQFHRQKEWSSATIAYGTPPLQSAPRVYAGAPSCQPAPCCLRPTRFAILAYQFQPYPSPSLFPARTSRGSAGVGELPVLDALAGHGQLLEPELDLVLGIPPEALGLAVQLQPAAALALRDARAQPM